MTRRDPAAFPKLCPGLAGAWPQRIKVAATPPPEALKMRKTHTRFVGVLAALLAAGLAGFSLRSQPKSSVSLAARGPAPAVTTQVIHRTIHIVRHEHPRTAPGLRPGSATRAGGGGVSGVRSVHTRASGSHSAGSAGAAVAVGGGAVTTRTSASRAATGATPSGSAPAGAPVTTRTSPSHASTPSGSAPTGARPTTRTSSHGSSGASGGKHVATRSSGGEDHGDHGD